MHVELLEEEPYHYQCGVFREPYHEGWHAVLAVGDEAYYLGVFGNHVDAMAAYLKAHLALKEN